MKKIMNYFWKSTLLSDDNKEKIYYYIRGLVYGKQYNTKNNEITMRYIEDILSTQMLNNAFSIDYPKYKKIPFENDDVKLLAYYLPQYYPDAHNDKWWGKGSTEWTNVSKSYPQYYGHYQPRLPGELGFYDLRVQDNIYRQIELAETYGIYGFAFYYYWFDGERILELPFDNFVNDKSITFPFCISWINTSWTKQWSGNSYTPLIEITKSKESYKKFIKDVMHLLKKDNYIKIKNRPLLLIYKPLDIPDRLSVLEYWRETAIKELGTDLYIIGSFNEPNMIGRHQTVEGFDAISEFAPGPQWEYMRKITEKKQFFCKDFLGCVYDYEDFVVNKRYFNIKAPKLYRAVTPMWDNTARKMNKGVILDGSTPELYKKWLYDVICETKVNKSIDDKVVFINAWNEWAEGTYLEPDLKWKYGYLEATKEAILKARAEND